MLHITLPAVNLYNEDTDEFIRLKEIHLTLEHSLVSVSKWESKWCKPFLGSDQKTNEEIIDYVRCMTLTQNVDVERYRYLTNESLEEISKYINAPMTATWFSEDDKKGSNKEIITSELIYYWMIALNIPVEFQKWHLNRLLTLIQVCNIKNEPPKKMKKSEIMNRNRKLNEARRKASGSKG